MLRIPVVSAESMIQLCRSVCLLLVVLWLESLMLATVALALHHQWWALLVFAHSLYFRLLFDKVYKYLKELEACLEEFHRSGSDSCN